MTPTDGELMEIFWSKHHAELRRADSEKTLTIGRVGVAWSSAILGQGSLIGGLDMATHHAAVDILILGAGWTSTFLKPLCESRKISVASTTRSGLTDTIQFTFDPTSDDPKPFDVLPKAKTVLITFPIAIKGAPDRLVRLYTQTHSQVNDEDAAKTAFIQLGTSTMWSVSLSSFLANQ
jgi:hypothetical protein